MKINQKHKLLKMVIALMLCVTLIQSTGLAADDTINVTLNGTKLSFDQNPIIENGRTLVPLRKIFESLNAFVEWEEETQTVTARKHSTEMSLTIGSNIAKVNGENYTLDGPAKVVNGRTLVPARFVAESLNCKVDWNDDTNTVIIKSAGQIEDKENLFSADSVKHGYYCDFYGKLRVNKDYNVSDFIKVEMGKTLYFTEYRTATSIRFITAYDADKNAINTCGQENITNYTVPEGVEYIKITLNSAKTASLKASYSNLSNGFINKEICIADGKKITIYSKQLISERRDDITFKWECVVGNEVNGNYEIEANGNIGSYPLKVTATNLDGKVIWEGNSTIKIVKNEISEIKLLAIGDSLTNNKAWQDKLDVMSSGNISFVGTRGNKYKHEGRSGFTSAGYLKETEYTFEKEGIHPFWDGERFNWNYYKQTTGVAPDVIQIFLGINGIQNNPQSNVSSILKMVDYIKNDDPNMPIFVVNTMYKGILTEDAEHQKVFNLMEKLTASLEDYDNVYIVPVAITHDSENNYSEKDQIHPISNGYEQIADVIYSSMCAHLK